MEALAQGKASTQDIAAMEKNTYGSGCFMLMHAGAKPI